MDINDLTREELKEQAELLGISFSEKERTEVLKQKIKVALGDVDDREEVFAHKATARDEERISIVLNESDTDKQPVQVGVNGRLFVIKRGVKVSVPMSVIEVLNNAQRLVWDGQMKEYNRVMRYPYRVQM